MIDVETIRREEFPIARRGVYLDNTTLGPPTARHVRAVTAFLELMSPHFYNTEAEIDRMLSCL